ncbi:bifunctional precorrin-2 dehydrogenase/sirohydrochlorin ferrochelatase [uncultured Muriicola sp.]|uniref:precorrin-2 dehydrogenase/sirohydrochlorin ferrochelatase family protein n=1 Tax=uncultured Muriicola sp. TaxID=1583102 RepID=UPI002635AB45|nr:bifunctional precorrin-2 dehydrogenase/sirohydrochlorin ferrochelatase [uncultured Muriicola sp.]
MERNNLYPIFLKTRQLEILIVGGGFVAEEKLRFLLKSSPDSQVTMVAPFYRPETTKLAKQYPVLRLKDEYHPKQLEGKHIVIATTDDKEVNQRIYRDCRQRNILVNVADNPPLCDFYMGGIVTKGHVKVAISTNGKSPTTAKRLRQFFEDILPDDISILVQNLNIYRKTLRGSFEYKMEKMNELTQTLVEDEN